MWPFMYGLSVTNIFQIPSKFESCPSSLSSPPLPLSLSVEKSSYNEFLLDGIFDRSIETENGAVKP